MAEKLKSDIDLDNPEFQDIWKLISYTRQSVFMTGKAGTGKSTFLRYIVEHTHKKTVVLAPTGIAAVNAGGVTLHSFFHIPLKPLLPSDPEFSARNLRQRLRHTSEQQKLIRELELVVIDEVSMVRADIIDFVDKVLRLYSGRMREPFGGKQMLFVGDIFQLEPVVTSDMRDIFRDLYPNPYFFSARVFREFALVPIELRKVYRQSDAVFISMLDRMRLGCSTAQDMEILNRRVVPAADSDSKKDDYVMTLAPKRATVDGINADRLAGIKRKLYTFKGDVSGEFPENSLPAPMGLELKVGAQVVFVRNDPEHRWVNGTIGKIHSVSKNTLEVELEGGAIHVVQREIWENISYKLNPETKKIEENVLGTFTQYPLRLAWALTIHKSQGLTFPKVVIDLEGGAFSSGQAYVALSRCQSLEGLTLRAPISSYSFFVNPSIRAFSGMFNNSALLSSALTMAKADDCFHRAARSFDAGDFTSAVDLFTEGLYARDELRNRGVNRLIKQKLYGLGRLQSRIEELEEQLARADIRFRELAEEYVAMGIDCLQDENFGAAIANFDKALSVAPGYREALKLKGEACMDGGDYLSAAAAFGELLRTDHADFDALFAIGKLYIILASEGRDVTLPPETPPAASITPELEKHSSKAIPITPEELRSNSIQVTPEELRYKALNYLLAAEEVNPDSAPLHDRLADLYSTLNDPEESDRHRSLARRLRRRT